MVSGTNWPGGDPFLQRQNEPSVAASSRNPLHLFAAANDYRSVDLPGLTGIEENGDAWIGIFTSLNGGLTWSSTLMPGCPYNVPDCAGAPAIQGLQAASDPTLRAGTNGLFFLSGLAFSRGTNAPSAVFVSRFIDNNDKESGNPIKFVSTSVVDTGTSGQFLDKPWLAIDIPRSGAASCSIPQDAGGAPFLAGNAYMVYSKFVGSSTTNPHTQVMFTMSKDCGATWSTPIKLSESYSVNQGTNVEINPVTGDVYVAWRMIQNQSANQPDAILFAKSTNQGSTFTKGTILATITPFDQNTSSLSFRTVASPTMAVDGNGVIYIAWSQRGIGPGGDARIVMITSPDSKNWSAPFAVENIAARGHQMMPAAAYAGGKVMITWYDFRDDHTMGVYTPLGGGEFSETRAPLCPAGSTNCDTSTQVFTSTISDAGLHQRHTMDLRVTQATPGATPVFESSARVSRYTVGSTPDNPSVIRQLQFNPPNLPMFELGTVPFIGDYNDLAPAVQFVTNSTGSWVYNTNSSSTPAFYAIWTDNRDVRPPLDGNWADYKVPVSAFTTSYGPTSVFDPTQNRPLCVNTSTDAGQTGDRNQNIYSAVIAQGLVAGTLGNTKPLLTPTGGQIQRGFVIFVQNKTDNVKTYNLNILPPASGQASFQPSQSLSTLTVSIAARSTISRTVFVISTSQYSTVTVTVNDPVSGALLTAVTLNPDPTNPTIVNADNLTTANIQTTEVYNADIVNADIVNQTLFNADIVNADIVNADIVNADIVNADIVNADIVNADIVNADIVNADIVNADIVNADIVNNAISDATWTLTNAGNTSTTYSIKLLMNSANLPPGTKLQLFVHKRATAPIALPNSCSLQVQGQNVIASSVPNPTVLTNASDLIPGPTDVTNSAIQNVTIALAPGEIGKVTLRIAGVSASVANQILATTKAAAGNQSSPLALIITSLSLPDGTVGSSYSQTLQASGGTGTRTWSLISDPTMTGLPPGFSLSPAGVLTGTPSAVGTFAFRVSVMDTGNSQLFIPSENDTQLLLLTIDPGTAILSLGNLSQIYDGTPKAVSVTTVPAGLTGITVTYNGSSIAPVDAGSYAVVATLNNPNYLTATSSGTLVVSPANQSITFGPLPNLTYGAAPFTVSATASSGLPVSFSAAGACTISGVTVTITAPGTCTITASQAGNLDYTAAASVSQTFTIAKAGTVTMITSSSPNPVYLGQTFTVTFTVSVVAPAVGTPTGTVTVTDGTVSCAVQVSTGSCSLTPTTSGTKTLTATYSGDAFFSTSSGTALQTEIVNPDFVFTGFLSPMVAAGTYSSPTFSGTFNLGKAVPIKWQLQDTSGNFITNQVPSTILTVASNPACTGVATGIAIVLWPSATGSTVLRYDTTNNQYVFNWDTSNQSAGCYNLVLQLADGSVRSTIVQLQ